MTARFALALALMAAGCRQTADGAREDARQAARDAERAAQDAKKEIDRAARDAQRAAKDARKEVREAMGQASGAMREARSAVREAERGVRDAAAEVNGAKQLVDVRAALALSSEISHAGDIAVASDEAGRTIVLIGTVPTLAEKSAAGRIARDHADGFRVDNRLQVAGR